MSTPAFFSLPGYPPWTEEDATTFLKRVWEIGQEEKRRKARKIVIEIPKSTKDVISLQEWKDGQSR